MKNSVLNVFLSGLLIISGSMLCANPNSNTELLNAADDGAVVIQVASDGLEGVAEADSGTSAEVQFPSLQSDRRSPEKKRRDECRACLYHNACVGVTYVCLGLGCLALLGRAG